MKSSDSLKVYSRIRQSLETEREQIIARLSALNAALGGGVTGVGGGRTADAVKKVRKPRAKRAKNALSLKEAMLKAVGKSALTKEEIAKAVEASGYKFSTSKPIASINTVLYTKGTPFKNSNGKFSVK